MTYFKNFTPELTKTLALNSIRNCILENYLSLFFEPSLFQCFPNAVWHMGVDYLTLEDEIEEELRNSINKIKLTADENLHQTLDVFAEQVYAEWKTILNV